MIGLLLRSASLAGIYLLVISSLDVWDIAAGLLLGLAVSFGLRRRRRPPLLGPESPITLGGMTKVLWGTAVEVVIGTWRTVKFCLGARMSPGLIEIPRGARSEVEVGLWGVLTGEAPDEIPVDADRERGVLVVHVLDTSDPEGVRARHHRTHETLHGRGGS